MKFPVNEINLKNRTFDNYCDLYCPNTGERITFTNKGYCLIEKDGKTFVKYLDGTIEEVFTRKKIGEEILPNGTIITKYHLNLPKTMNNRKESRI